MPAKRYIFFLVALACALTLLFVSIILVYHYVNKPSDTIIIHNIVLSDEIENRSRLTGTVSRFSYGTRQMFLFFNFEKAQIGTDIEVSWYYGGKEILTETYTLEEPSGSRIYCLLKEDGSSLPKGNYSLKITQGDKTVIPEYVFSIF